MKKVVIVLAILLSIAYVFAQPLQTVESNLKNFFTDFIDDNGEIFFNYKITIEDDSTTIESYLGYNGHNIMSYLYSKDPADAGSGFILFIVNRKLNGVLAYTTVEDQTIATLIFIDYVNRKILGFMPFENIDLSMLYYDLYEQIKNGSFSDNPVSLKQFESVIDEDFFKEVDKLIDFLYKGYEVIKEDEK